MNAKIKNKIVCCIIALTFLISPMIAQDGAPDLTFNSLTQLSNIGQIASVKKQSNGKIIVAGRYIAINGQSKNGISRLNIDGTIDNTFNSGVGISGPLMNNVSPYISCIAVQPDDKIVLVGSFYKYNNVVKNSIVRLNVDGSIDASFNTGTGFISQFITTIAGLTITNNSPGTIYKVQIRNDGKILICYSAKFFNGLARSTHLILLNTDGTIDNTFNFVETGSIYNYEIQTDNKIIIAITKSTSFGSQLVLQFDTYLKRLNTNGTIDNTFTLNNTIINQDNTGGMGGTTFPGRGEIYTIKQLSNGQILIAGRIYTIFGNNINICKLNSNGTVDSSFQGLGAINFNSDLYISDLLIQDDGKIIIAGKFSLYNNVTCNNLLRLNSNGTIDNTFAVGNGINGGNPESRLYKLEKYSSNKIIAIGNFLNYNSVAYNSIVRIFNSNLNIVDDNFTLIKNCNGSITIPDIRLNDKCSNLPANSSNTNLSFVSSSNININLNSFSGVVTVGPTVAPGTYTLVYKLCDSANFTSCATGTVTIKVNPSLAANNDLIITTAGTASAIIADVRSNDVFNCTQAITSSNTNLSFLNSTNAGITLNLSTGAVNIANTVPPGFYILKYSICDKGNISNCSTGTVTIQVNIATVNTPILVAGNRANSVVNNIDFQNNSKIIIAGGFTTYNSVAANNIARLNTNLTLDNTFVSTGPNPSGQIAKDMKIQYDDKIIVVGNFESFSGGANTRRIARLNSDGSADTSFNSAGVGIGSNGTNTITACAIQQDGKILISGLIFMYNGITISNSKMNLIRLNANGSYDNTFNTPTSISHIYKVANITQQLDGKILVTANTLQTGLPNIYRLNLDGSIDPTFTPGNTGANVYPNYCVSCNEGPIVKLLIQPDNKIILAGAFDTFNGLPYKNIVRINSNGTIDNTFNALASTNRVINAVEIEPTGKIIIGGEFTSFNGSAVNRLARLNTNGTLDNTFNIGTGTTQQNLCCGAFIHYVRAIKRQGDGKVIIVGGFATYNGINATNITRINPSIAGSQARMAIEYGNSNSDIKDFSQNITIYPNPSTDIFYYDTSETTINYEKITVFNILGKIVKSIDIVPSAINEINLSELEKGVYIAQLSNNLYSIHIKLLKN